MLDEIGETGQLGQEPGPGPGSDASKELTAGIQKERIKCPDCERTFDDMRGLGPHQRFHHPKDLKVSKGPKVNKVAGGEVKEPASDLIEQVVSETVKQQLTQIIPELKKGIEENLSTTMVEAIRLINEKVNTEVSNLAQKVETEILARFPAAGAGNLPAAQGGMGGMNPIVQALLARFMGPNGGSDGGGNFLQQAANIGQAIGAMLQPIQNIQAAAFSNSLKLMDIAQKWGTATPAEKETLLGEVNAVAGAPPPAAPPVPPPPATGKAPGALGPGS